MPSPSSDPKRSPLADPAAITRSVKDGSRKDSSPPRANSGAEEPDPTSADTGRPSRRFKGFRDTSQARRGEKPRPGQSRFRRPTWPGPSDQPTARRPRQAQIDKEASEGKGPDGEDPERDESAAGSTKTEDTSSGEKSGEDRSSEGASGEGSAPEEEAVGEATEKSLEERWQSALEDYREGDRKQARDSAADLTREERTFVTVRLDEELYVLDPSTMTYHSGGPQALKELLAERLGPHFSRREAREITARIKADTYVGGFGQARAIPLRNGDLETRPLALLDFDSNRRFLVRTKAQRDPGARCPAFKSFLRDAVPFGRQVLQDYAGYCLLHWARPYRRILLLVGPNGVGGEVYLRALREIIPWFASAAHPALLKKRPGPPSSRARGSTPVPRSIRRCSQGSRCFGASGRERPDTAIPSRSKRPSKTPRRGGSLNTFTPPPSFRTLAPGTRFSGASYWGAFQRRSRQARSQHPRSFGPNGMGFCSGPWRALSASWTAVPAATAFPLDAARR